MVTLSVFRRLFAILAVLLVLPCLADVSVRGYTRKDGTYVRPHMRSSPNSSKSDNWSTKGNINPYTGEPGTKPLYGSENSSAPTKSNTRSSTYETNREALPGATSETIESIQPAYDSSKESPGKSSESLVPPPSAVSPDASSDSKPISRNAIEPKKHKTNKEIKEFYCSMRLEQYHWNEKCSMLKGEDVTPLLIETVKRAKYSECKLCKADNESGSKIKAISE